MKAAKYYIIDLNNHIPYNESIQVVPIELSYTLYGNHESVTPYDKKLWWVRIAICKVINFDQFVTVDSEIFALSLFRDFFLFELFTSF